MPTPILNPFEADGFTVYDLTMAINRVSTSWGTLNDSGLFPDTPVTTKNLAIDEQDGVLNLLETREWGAAASVNMTGGRKTRSFEVPHNPLIDAVLPEEVMGVRAFGSGSAVESLASKVVEKMANMRRKHMITMEYRKWGALSGNILDADGTSVITNLFTEFVKVQKEIDFVLGTPGTDIKAKCAELIDHIELNIQGETWADDQEESVRAYASPEFLDKFVAHDEVKRAFDNWNGYSNRLGSDQRKGFPFAGILWSRHLGRATHINPTTFVKTVNRFIPADDARAYPLGTSDTFKTFNAPANMNETVNTPGLPFYARSEVRKLGKGMDVYTEANHLPICGRPEVLVRAHTSN